MARLSKTLTPPPLSLPTGGSSSTVGSRRNKLQQCNAHLSRAFRGNTEQFKGAHEPVGAHSAKARLAESRDAQEAPTKRMIPRDFRVGVGRLVRVVGIHHLPNTASAGRRRVARISLAPRIAGATCYCFRVHGRLRRINHDTPC